MKLLQFTLRGAIGIYDGLGADQVSIDFTRFEPGLVALVGPNGSGKTTILENLHPYRQLASREGALSNHFVERDSRRDLTFEINGHTYRSLISIDGYTGKQEAYLYKNQQPLNDGKTTTYDAEVEKLLGSPDLFFKSIFSSQNAESITSLTAGKRKELFIELLGLQRYELYAEHAKGKADELERDLQTKRGRIEQISAEVVGREKLQSDIERGEGRLTAFRSQVEMAEQKSGEARAKATKLEMDLAENESWKNLLVKEERELAELQARRLGIEADARNEMNDVNVRVKAIQDELQRKREIVSHGNVINGKVDELLGLRIEEKDLASTKDRLNQLENEEAAAKLSFEKAKAVHERAVSNQRQKVLSVEAQRDKILEQWDRKLEDLKQARSEAERTARLVLEVPCRNTVGLPEQCKLLSAAINAEKRIPTLDVDIASIESGSWKETSGLATLESEIATLDAILQDMMERPPINGLDFTSKKAALHYDADRHATVRSSIVGLESERWESLQKELGIAQAVIIEKEEALGGFQSQLENLHDKTVKRLAEVDVKLDEKRKEIDGISGSISETIRGEYESAKREEQALVREASELKEHEHTLITDLAVLKSSLERIDKLDEELAVLTSEITSLGRSIENWRLVQRACSKDGIPALELDAAGPEVSRIANELLSSTFGSRFQIAFETTRLTKDKKRQLETFEIRVYGEDGEKRIEDLSGGQRVWIEKALQEAIAIHLSEKSGKEFLTSYADEADGALDPDNKQHFLDMLRESFRLGRRHFTFVVTQTPEIWSQVQQRVHLHPESSSIECVY